MTGKIIYAYVTYIAHGMVFTAVGLPYSAISAVMTQNQQERAVISTYRMFFAVVVAISIVILVRRFSGLFATPQEGYTVAVLGMAVISSILLMFAYTQSKERLAVKRERYGIKDILPYVIKNDALRVLALAMFLNTCVWVTINAVALYYFKYVYGDESMWDVFWWLMLPANILGAVITPILTKRYGKRRIFMFGSIVVAVFYASRQFLPVSPFFLFLGISLIAQFGQMLCSITQWGMLPDTVEYGHWKTGFRSEGIPFAFFSFMQKAGLAVAGALATFVLYLVDYQANAVQTEASLTAIEWLFNLAPAAYSLLCLITLMFYKLDSKMFDKITAELAAREG